MKRSELEVTSGDNLAQDSSQAATPAVPRATAHRVSSARSEEEGGQRIEFVNSSGGTQTDSDVANLARQVENHDSRVAQARERIVQEEALEKGGKKQMLLDQMQRSDETDNLQEEDDEETGRPRKKNSRRQSEGLVQPEMLSALDLNAARGNWRQVKAGGRDGNEDLIQESNDDSTPPSNSSTAKGRANDASSDPATPAPGAYPIQRRAFGQRPAWRRQNPPPENSPQEPQTTNSSTPGEASVRRTFSRQIFASMSMFATHFSESTSAVPRAEPVDAELVVYPEAVQTSEEIERAERASNKRRRLIWGGMGCLVVAALVVGLLVGFEVGVSSDNNNDSSGATTDLELQCDALLETEDPNIPRQCQFCKEITVVSTEVNSTYQTLNVWLELNLTVDTSSCEPRNLALLWLANDTLITIPGFGNLPERPDRPGGNGTEGNETENEIENETEGSCVGGRTRFFVQRYVLALMYFSLGGPDWPRQQNWLSSEEECEWQGVGCSFVGERRIFELDLEGQNAMGTIPEELERLCDLRQLELGINQITGPLSSTLFLNLKSLRRIAVQGNRLAGPIPDVVNLDDLENIDLGVIQNMTLEELAELEEAPEDFVEVVETQLLGGRDPLYSLDFSDNRFNGTLPQGFRLLRFLREARLDNNDLAGSIIPESPIFSDIALFVDIETFSLRNNSFRGSMPSFIGLLTRLEFLDAAFNDLTGTVVSEIGNLAELTTLRLGANDIRGTVPTEILRLERLVDLDLSFRFLEPRVPDELCNHVFLDPPILVFCNGTTGRDFCRCCACEEPRCRPRPGRPCDSSMDGVGE